MHGRAPPAACEELQARVTARSWLTGIGWMSLGVSGMIGRSNKPELILSRSEARVRVSSRRLQDERDRRDVDREQTQHQSVVCVETIKSSREEILRRIGAHVAVNAVHSFIFERWVELRRLQEDSAPGRSHEP